jgi:ADP-ribose pyrophosphatase YjhB (NUDIX family)
MNEAKIRTIVLGIFRHQDRLLVFEGSDPARDVVFYRPLGGGIEFGEYGHQALAREMQEELDAEVTDIRFLGTIQNIFSFRGRQGHEIVLLYEGRFAEPSFYERQTMTGNDNGIPIEVSWKPLVDFENGALLVPRELLGFLKQDDRSA